LVELEILPQATAIRNRYALKDSIIRCAQARLYYPHERLIDFAELCRVVGFDDYYTEEARYGTDTPPGAAPGAAIEAPKRGAAE